MRRALAALTIAVAGVVLPAEPAAAHGAAGGVPTNWATAVVAVAPARPGLHARAVDGGLELEVVNATPVPVVVLGSDGRPWIRISPGATVRWHDHRIHNPSAVSRLLARLRPGRRDVAQAWSVPAVVGAQPTEIRGTLRWVPGPTPWPWAVVALVVAAGVVAAACTRRRYRALAAAALVAGACEALHVGAAAAAVAGPAWARVGSVLAASGLAPLVGVAAALVAARLLARGTVDGIAAGAFAGVVALVLAAADTPAWWRSQVPTALPAWADRGVVAGALGAGAGLLAGSLVAWWRDPTMRGWTRRLPSRSSSPPPATASASTSAPR